MDHLSHKQLSLVLGAFVLFIIIAIGLTMVRDYVQERNIKGPSISACTEEAKICPDGSAVGRTGPNCEFAPCPTLTPTPSQSDISPTQAFAEPSGNCVVAGCSSELCVESSEASDLFSPCVYREEYACLSLTTCERQESGNCGWTENGEFLSCMSDYK